MRNVKIVIALAVVVAMLSGCKKDEYAEPVITWTPDNLSNYVIMGNEDTYNKTLEISFKAEAGIGSIKINKLVYTGEDLYYEASAVAPTGYEGEIDFEYSFTTTNEMSDFTNGVTEIVYQVVLVDANETPREIEKKYIFFVNEAHAVTINVEDEEGEEITDAVVTFNEVEMTNAPYTFEYIQAGTYAYTIEKEGYETVNVAEFNMIDQDTVFTVTLMESIENEWSDSIPLALSSEVSWAQFNGEEIGTDENTTIGFAFTHTDGATFKVEKTDNCEGWVVVDAAEALAFTAVADLETAYEAGSTITAYDLPATIVRAYEARYFISKVDEDYLLVKYVYGYRNGEDNTGNVVVFQYKD